MNDPLAFVLVALIALTGPLLLSVLNNRQVAEKEKRDYARQDLVASTAKKDEEDRKTAAELVAELAAAHSAEVASALQSIDGQAKEIHILVNSDMTAARTAERDSMRATAVMMKRVLAMNVDRGLITDKDDIEALAAVEARIVELDAILADRHAAQLRVEADALNA